MGLLAWITLLPLFGAGAGDAGAARRGGHPPRPRPACTALATFLVSLLILPDFDAAQAGFQLRGR